MHYDLLVKIKNAEHAKKELFLTPFSKFDFSIAKLLSSSGYLAAAERKSLGKKNVIEIKLRYRGARPAMRDFRIMSKPGRRLYRGYRDLTSIRQNHGISVLSTPEGIVTNKEAIKKKLGGEYLFEVW